MDSMVNKLIDKMCDAGYVYERKWLDDTMVFTGTAVINGVKYRNKVSYCMMEIKAIKNERDIDAIVNNALYQLNPKEGTMHVGGGRKLKRLESS